MTSGRRDAAASSLAWGVAAFVGGLAAGTLAWGEMMRRSQRDLFCPSPLRRLAALGYLAGRPGHDTARLLSDYLAWERHPLLRRRGRLLLDRMAPHLD